MCLIGHSQENEKMAHRERENICKSGIWQGSNFQNIKNLTTQW